MRSRSSTNDPSAASARKATGNGADRRMALDRRISLIVHRVNSRFTQIANKLLTTQGITMYDSRILLFLLEREEMRVGELVVAMALPQSTISHQLKQLQARKLIRRRRSRKDNRSVVVTLTPAGEQIARACEQYSVLVQRRLIESFSADQIDQLTTLLNATFDVLEVSQFSPDQTGSTAIAAEPMERPGRLRRVAVRRSRAIGARNLG